MPGAAPERASTECNAAVSLGSRRPEAGVFRLSVTRTITHFFCEGDTFARNGNPINAPSPYRTRRPAPTTLPLRQSGRLSRPQVEHGDSPRHSLCTIARGLATWNMNAASNWMLSPLLAQCGFSDQQRLMRCRRRPLRVRKGVPRRKPLRLSSPVFRVRYLAAVLSTTPGSVALLTGPVVRRSLLSLASI